MKITDYTTFVVDNPLPPGAAHDSQDDGEYTWDDGGPYWIFLKLTTDRGVAGYGETYSVPFNPQVAARMIEDVCERNP
jgi:L-alanine-DL-glutamate epimerase-like enolase superfamily enzyme